MKMVLLFSACVLGVAGCATHNNRPAAMYDPYAVNSGTVVSGGTVVDGANGNYVVETSTTYSEVKKPGHDRWADWNFSTDRDRMSIQRYIDLQFPPMPQPHSDY